MPRILRFTVEEDVDDEAEPVLLTQSDTSLLEDEDVIRVLGENRMAMLVETINVLNKSTRTTAPAKISLAISGVAAKGPHTSVPRGSAKSHEKDLNVEIPVLLLPEDAVEQEVDQANVCSRPCIKKAPKRGKT